MRDDYEQGSIDTANAIFNWLGRTYGPTVQRAAVVSWNAGDMQPETVATVVDDPRGVARAQGFTGDECDHCHSIHMQQTGHCLTCADCGTTTGCA